MIQVLTSGLLCLQQKAITKGKIKDQEDLARKEADKLLQEAQREKQRLIEDAKKEGESIKRDRMLEAKEKFLQLKSEHENETNSRNRK